MDKKTETNGIKEFISLTCSAKQCKPYIWESHHYSNDTDDYETEDEFNDTLMRIASNNYIIESFINFFDESRVVEEYFYEQPDKYAKLAQTYRNYIEVGKPNEYYTRSSAEANLSVSNAYYEFKECIVDFLRNFAPSRLTPLEIATLPPALAFYFEDEKR